MSRWFVWTTLALTLLGCTADLTGTTCVDRPRDSELQSTCTPSNGRRL